MGQSHIEGLIIKKLRPKLSAIKLRYGQERGSVEALKEMSNITLTTIEKEFGITPANKENRADILKWISTQYSKIGSDNEQT